MRELAVRTAKAPREHKTGRLCEANGCRGALIDTVVSPGENMKPDVKIKAQSLTGRAKLMLIIGARREDPVFLPLDGRYVLIDT